MKKRFSKLTIISLELIALLLALLFIAVFFAHHKISNGGLTLAPIKNRVEKVLEDRFADGSDVTLGGIYLIRDERNGEVGPVRLIAHDLEVKTTTGETALNLSELTLRVELSDLLRGQISPHDVEVVNAAISIRRLENGDYDFGLQRGDSEVSKTSQERNFLEVMLESANDPTAPPIVRLFKGATLRDASLKFTDEISGQIWQAQSVSASLSRDPLRNLLTGTISAPFDFDGNLSKIDLLIEADPASQTVETTIAFNDAPMRNILGIILGDEIAQQFDAAVTGTVSINTSLKGKVSDAFFFLDSKNGVIRLGDKTTPFKALHLETAYMHNEKKFDIRALKYDIDGNQANAIGQIWLLPLSTKATQAPESVKFDLDLSDVVLDLDGITAEALPIKQAALSGLFDRPTTSLQFDHLDVDLFEAKLKADLALGFAAEGSPSIKANAVVEQRLSPQQVLRAWPLVLAPGARLWLDRNVIDGNIRNIDFTMDLPAGSIVNGQGIPKDSLTLTFDIDNVSTEYVPGMTPIKQAKGSAVMDGNSFSIDVPSGRLAGLSLRKGSVNIPAFYPKGQNAIFKAEIAGDIRTMLGVIDEKPLNFISKGGMSPSDFSGESVFSLSIKRPMIRVVPIEDYDFKGQGKYDKLLLEDFIPGYDLEQANGELFLSNDKLKIVGEAEIRGTPVDVSWERSFAGAKTTFINAKGKVDSLAADAFGLPIRKFVRGDVSYSLNTWQNANEKGDIQVNADITNALIDFEKLGYQKNVGTEGTLTFRLLPPSVSGGNWVFRDIDLETDGFELKGGFSLFPDLRVSSLSFDRLFIENRAEFSLQSERQEDGSTNAKILGAYGNVDVLLSDFFKGAGGSQLPGGINLDVTLNKLKLRNEVILSGFSAVARHNGISLQDLSLAGQFVSGGAMTVGVQDRGEGAKVLTLKTDMVGTVVNGLFGIASVEAGGATLTATLIPDGPIAGTVAAAGFRITGAPLIARIFAAGSFDGLSDLLNDAGIEFTDMQSRFILSEGVLTIEDAMAVGPSVGLSGNGDIDFDKDDFDLNGAVAPAYVVNSLLGNIPGFGEILVSRKGEGLVAVSYGVDGALREPTITVNALSALTPGIFRRIFEPIRDKKPTTEELLKLAMEEAVLLEQRENAGSVEELIGMEKRGE